MNMLESEVDVFFSNQAQVERHSRRPVKEMSERRRDHLLQAAQDEFLVNGFAGANLDRIAARCKMSKMTIYRRIGTKEDLFLLVTVKAVKGLELDYQAVIDRGGTPWEVIGAIVKMSQERSRSDRLALLRLAIADGKGFPALMARMLKRTEEINAPVAAYISRISAKPLSEAEAVRHAHLLMCMSAGGFLKLLDYADAEGPEWADTTTRIFLSGIGVLTP